VSEQTVYERVGGAPAFTRLVASFYARVAEDPVLRPLYPDEELAAAEERLRLFLVQYWGGPTTYSETRGHPRLRMRHAPFRIGAREAEAWRANMRAALDELALPPELDVALWDHMDKAADFLRNTDEPLDPRVAR
jgi:hemoglobin